MFRLRMLLIVPCSELQALRLAGGRLLIRSTASLAVLLGLNIQPVRSEEMPADVAAFFLDRQQCEHFLGEEPYDAERAAQIEEALDRYCRGTDGRLAQLKRRYAQGPSAVRQALDALDDKLE